MPALIAITRSPGPSLAGGELAHKPRLTPDPVRATTQHDGYRAALAALGSEITNLPPLPGHPDAVFVEDTAIVVDELAILTRPGAAPRQGEVESMAKVLAPHREIVRLEEPATLDGGDVLRIDRTFYVGRSARSNAEGRAALSRVLAPHDYWVEAVDMNGCLHLKTAICHLGQGRVLVNRAWMHLERFPDYEAVDVHPDEPFGANVIRYPKDGGGETLLVLASAPRTAEKLAHLGYEVQTVDVSEFEKMEGSLTCLSLLFPAKSRR